jgi:hypothetical protein
MIVVVAGVIGRQPLPGQVWYWLQHLLGFRRLGHEVYFLEESGDYAYTFDFEGLEESHDERAAARVLHRCLEPFGFGDRWAYRASETALGIGRSEFAEVCAVADVFITHSTAVWKWRPEYDRPRARVLLDGDPVFTQLRALRGDWPIPEAIAHCNRFFTYGPGLLRHDSPIPDLGFEWSVARPPVVLEHWPASTDPAAERFTTVMHWSLDPSPALGGEIYGQKDVEFERVIDLPSRTLQSLEVALNDGPFDRLRAHGWHVVDRPPTDLDAYQAYIRRARGEFSVAKNAYVKARTGWMSERTTCFLASGKPAVVQETGLSDWVPTGEGLLAFSTVDEAVASLDSVNAEYERHARAARRLAEEYFDSDVVLAALLEEAVA